MVFLSEWNNDAVAIILVLFLIPVTIVFLLLLLLTRLFPKINLYIRESKKRQPLLYCAILLLLYIIAFFITVGLGSLFNL